MPRCAVNPASTAPPKRDALHDSALMLVFNRFPEVRMRRFDAAGLHGHCTEVLVWETTDVAEYRDAVDSLHQHDFFGRPCFEVVDVIPSVPDGWREFDWGRGHAFA
jgi:hypothetical protein